MKWFDTYKSNTLAMKNKKSFKLMFAILIIIFCMSNGCGSSVTSSSLEDFGDEEEMKSREDIEDKEEMENDRKNTFYSIYPENESIVSLASNEVNEWLRDYMIGSAAAYYDEGDIYMSTPVEFSWECNKEAMRYTLSLAKSSEMSGCVVVDTTENTVTYEDLLVGTDYYWQITAYYEVGSETSKIFHFRTADTPRTISIEGVSNVRDIGGYTTESGKKVKQGMIYRGATLDEITEEGRNKAINIYGIKTDLDLRIKGEGTAGNVSPLGDDVRYINISGPYYVGNSVGIDDKKNWDELASEIKVFADETSYPVYMHCSLGRDRTGTLAFLINALLGVSKEDIYREYELSFFSKSGCKDGAAMSSMISKFTTLYKYIAYYGDINNTLSEQTEQFLLEIGVAQEEIDAIRAIMLE